MRSQATRRWSSFGFDRASFNLLHRKGQSPNCRKFWRSFAAGVASPIHDKGLQWTGIDPAVAPHVRTCLGQIDNATDRRRFWDTQFHAYFLGTGAGTSFKRNPACTVVRLGSEGLVFDVGEGSKDRIKKSIIKLKKVSKIFITHLHADHVMGLPGLLLSSNLINLFEPESTLQIFGPPGLYNFVVANVALTHSKLRMTIEVYELVGGQCRVHWRNRGMLGSFPQFQHPNVIRKTIRCNEDGVWRIKAFDPVTRETNSRLSSDFQVMAAELYHVPNVQTFGYVIEEQEPFPRIDAKRAENLGIAAGIKYQELKNGFPVLNDDGTREVQPNEVVFKSPFKARKFVVLGDTCGIPPSMAKLCTHADVIVHEATLQEVNRELSVRRGHSTASMAGHFADTVEANLLVLNHLGGSAGETQQPAKDAEEVIKGGTKVVSAMDFMELAIPREGFKFRDKANNRSSGGSGNNLLPEEASDNNAITDIIRTRADTQSTASRVGLLPVEGSKIVKNSRWTTRGDK